MSATLTRLDLELTGKCPLECPFHCYAASGPNGGHGTMALSDWTELLEEGAGLGVTRVQLIGGEPTTHPDFERILLVALGYGPTVEVFSNLVAIRDSWWRLFCLPGVSLATSYYSAQADKHDRITGRVGSHTRTRANIVKALELGIKIRAAIVGVHDDQDVQGAIADLKSMGVVTIGTDWVRPYGRGVGDRPVNDVSKLCGRCGDGKAAVNPDGDVWPCVMSRWMTAGNVRETPLGDIIGGPRWCELVATVPAPRHNRTCNPDCKPSSGDGSDCAPAETEYEPCDPD
ncbi:radical SAM/SPASM domain-containing protein [Streptosporangium sp. NPDC006007]|uniref:radical SAM/SPASM domain-containing protein n=1 Tax=Streptosporangium sp. NPDC006007 TaxID=3154575 RepID=UPI0033B4088A